MLSPTKGPVTYDQIAKDICDFVKDNLEAKYSVYIGTDSQNFDVTKIVSVIAVHRIGNGGKFFYEISRVNRITDIRQKLYTETQLSLECAEKLFDALDKYSKEINFDYKKYLSFSIHVDAGYNGPTKQLIPGIVGWIHASGYKCEVKPYSPAASAIANKYSK